MRKLWMIKYTDFPITSNYPFNKNIFILFQKKSISPFRLSVRKRFLFPLLFLVSPRQGATRALVSPCFSLLAVSRTPPERTHEYFKGPLPANDSPSRSSSPSAVFSTFAITVRCTLGGKTIPIGKRRVYDRDSMIFQRWATSIEWCFYLGCKDLLYDAI